MKFEHSHSDNRFSFPATLTPDLDDGGYVVTFRDLPEAITQGDSIELALQEAADCIEEAMQRGLEGFLLRATQRLPPQSPFGTLARMRRSRSDRGKN